MHSFLARGGHLPRGRRTVFDSRTFLVSLFIIYYYLPIISLDLVHFFLRQRAGSGFLLDNKDTLFLFVLPHLSFYSL